MHRLLKSLWVGCIVVSACVPLAAPPVPEPSASSTATTPQPGDSHQGSPVEFPPTPILAKVTPSILCAGDTATVHASQLPANTPIEIWGTSAGVEVGKLGNPPHPREYGARQLGMASTDAAGNLVLDFELSPEMADSTGAFSTSIALWFVYPTTQSNVRVRPKVTTFFVCSFSISGEAPDGLTTEVGKEFHLKATATNGAPIAWSVAGEDVGEVSIQSTAASKRDSVATLRTLQPGGVRVIAEASGQRAESLFAILDPATSSIPVPLPSGFPFQASVEVPLGSRVLTDNTGWNMFMGELRQGQPSTGGLEPPPIDFSSRSLVVVIAKWDPLESTCRHASLSIL